MRKLYFFDKTKTYIFPNGKIAPPDVVAAEYPAAAAGLTTYVVTSDEEGLVMGGMDMLSTLRTVYNIAPELSEEDAVAAIEEIMNTPPEPAGPDAQERIAAALEYQVMSDLPDAEEE